MKTCHCPFLTLFLLLLLPSLIATAQPDWPSADSTNGELQLGLRDTIGGTIWGHDTDQKNMIFIRHKEWNATFALHLFEDMMIPVHVWPTPYRQNRRINADLFEWQHDGQAWNFHLKQDSEVAKFEINGRIWPSYRQVKFTARVTNQDTLSWAPDVETSTSHACSTLFCLRHHLNPEFRDPQGERVNLYRNPGGGIVSAFDAAGLADAPYFFFLVDKMNSQFLPKISKLNQNLDRRVTFTVDPCSSLLGNRSDAICCIHANPLIGLKPGESVDITGQIKFEDLPTAVADPWEYE